MSLQSELLAKVTAVLTKMNLWETNAKKTEELEAMDEVDASSLVRVSVGGVSKKLELQKLIDASVSTTYNYFNPTGQLTFVDNELTIPNSQWLINAVNYQKLTPTVVEIPFSETGKTRIDLIYANTLNQILKETGFETVGVAIPPNLPFNTVEVTKIVVTDSEIESVIPGIPSDRNKEDKVSGVVAFGTNDYTATVPEVTELVTGLKILVTFENPNTSVSRMNLNGLSDEPIVKNYNTPVSAGDLTGTMILMYSLDKWVVVGSIGGSGDIGYVPENTVNKSTTMTGNETSNVLFLTAKAVYDWAIALFQKKATASTGSTIQFDTDRIYNSIASPTTGAMTNNLTGAQIGVIQKIYYNHSTTNPFPAGWVRLGSKTYTPSALNIIYAEWVGSSRVEYWISQES